MYLVFLQFLKNYNNNTSHTNLLSVLSKLYTDFISVLDWMQLCRAEVLSLWNTTWCLLSRQLRCFAFALFSLKFFELLQYVPPHEVRFTLKKRSSGWTINPSGVLLSLPDRLSFPSAAKFVNNWTVKLEILQQKHAENKTEFNYKVKCSFYTNYISTMKKNRKNH